MKYNNRSSASNVFSLEPSASPPRGLAPDAVPQLVSFSFDDNGYSGYPESGATGGMKFIFETFNSRRNPAGTGNEACFDGAPVSATFYLKGDNLSGGSGENGSLVRLAWKEAVARGNEIGLHTFTHPHGSSVDWYSDPPARKDLLDRDAWLDEINRCRNALIDARIGLDSSSITGFRTPYLEYNASLFDALADAGLSYDASIEEGWQDDCGGANLLWPYTLGSASPGDDWISTNRFMLPSGCVGSHPELLELPVYVLTAPPDELCASYGTEPGLRSRMKKEKAYFDEVSGKFTGVDWNIWFEFFLSEADAFACLAHSFDLRYSGNRCPFFLGAHSDIYSDLYDKNDLEGEDESRIKTGAAGRRNVLAAFLDYVLEKSDARIATMEQCRKWLMHPVPLARPRSKK